MHFRWGNLGLLWAEDKVVDWVKTRHSLNLVHERMAPEGHGIAFGSLTLLFAVSTVLTTTASLSASAQVPSVDAGRGPVGVHVPLSYNSETPMPLVMLLHGYGSNGASQEAYMNFAPLAEEFGFLYLHPDGRFNADTPPLRFWSGTDACCNFFGNSDDDDDYLMDLIDEMKSLYNVDPLRVYLIGHSNGGFMSYRMACENSDTIAAIASLAGATFFNPFDCRPTDPVHILQIHGTNDGTILYAGGDIIGTNYPGAIATVEQWAAKNGCAIVADTSAPNIDLVVDLAGPETTVTRYFSSCNSGGSAELWTVINGVHVPALSSTFSRLVVEFLYAHPKPTPGEGEGEGVVEGEGESEGVVEGEGEGEGVVEGEGEGGAPGEGQNDGEGEEEDTAEPPAIAFSVTPTVYDYGEVPVGFTSDTTFTIFNPSDSVLGVPPGNWTM